MEYHFVDHEVAGCVTTRCDCGAEFDFTEEAIDHAATHFREQDRRSVMSMLDRVGYLLSPNPVIIDSF